MKPPALSIRHRVIVLVCGLTLAGAAASSWMAYVELRRAALSTTRERLTVVTHQLTDMLAASGEELRTRAAGLASNPRVRTYLRDPGSRTESAAVAVLDSVVRQEESVEAVALYASDGRRLIGVGHDGAAGFASPGHILDVFLDGDTAVVGPFRLRADTVVYAAAATVQGTGGDVLGHVVQRQRIAGSEESGRQLRELIEPGSALLVGNAAGDVWTNLVRAVPGPPVDVAPTSDTLLHYVGSDGSGRLAAVERVPGTPWLVLLEFPRAPVVAGARRVAGRLALIMGLLAAIGAAAAWLLASRLLRPLGEAAEAAGAVAKGDYARRLQVRGRDELGKLAESFNVMAEQVQGAQERLEQKVVERTAELRAVNEELEAFSYSVSHDLRAPLRSIDGFCQALLEDAEDDLDEVGKGHLQRVRAASQRMARLIDDLLELSRVTRSEMTRQRVDLTQLAHEIVDDLTADRKRDADVVIEPDLEAVGDRRLLRVALQNLIGNAWKFTGHRRRARIEVGAEREDGHTVFYVRDNGAGFDMRYVGQLFTPFQRLHGATEFEGTGIGLATVQRIVHRHGGRVWADGVVDRGATIRFTLDHVDVAEAGHG